MGEAPIDNLGVSEADIELTDEQWRARGYDKCGCGEWLEPGRVTWCKVGLKNGRCAEVGGTFRNRWCESCLLEMCAGIQELADKCMNREMCPWCLLEAAK